jgi:hypothetical protein
MPVRGATSPGPEQRLHATPSREKNDTLHASHAVRATLGSAPALHRVQVLEPSVVATMPTPTALHGKHDVPFDENVPTGQRSHVVPDAAGRHPTLHGSHDGIPRRGATSDASHRTHHVPLLLYSPSPHSVHAV